MHSSIKTECFSNKGGYGTCIYSEAHEGRLATSYNAQPSVTQAVESCSLNLKFQISVFIQSFLNDSH